MNIEKQKQIVKAYRDEYMPTKNLEDIYYAIDNYEGRIVREINEENKDGILLTLDIDEATNVSRIDRHLTIDEIRDIIATEPTYKPYHFTNAEHEKRNYCHNIYFNDCFIDIFYLIEDEGKMVGRDFEMTPELMEEIAELEARLLGY